MSTSDIEGEQTLNLATIRAEIDRIDAAVIALLGERARWVEKAGKFKPTVAQVRVPERERQVIQRVCQLSVEHGIDPSFAEQLYLMMLDYFVSHEQNQVRQRGEEQG